MNKIMIKIVVLADKSARISGTNLCLLLILQKRQQPWVVAWDIFQLQTMTVSKKVQQKRQLC